MCGLKMMPSKARVQPPGGHWGRSTWQQHHSHLKTECTPNMQAGIIMGGAARSGVTSVRQHCIRTIIRPTIAARITATRPPANRPKYQTSRPVLHPPPLAPAFWRFTRFACPPLRYLLVVRAILAGRRQCQLQPQGPAAHPSWARQPSQQR
jgi:hypothetical protein